MAISLLRLPEVKARTGRSGSSIYADIQRGEFPKPVNIGSRAVAWSSESIDQWIQLKIDQANESEVVPK